MRKSRSRTTGRAHRKEPREAPAAPAGDQAAAPLSGAGEAVPFPIVGIGASAGGLEALRQFFGQVSADAGLAFVVIQHLGPDRPSMLTSVLAGMTALPVAEASDGLPVERNRVYVIPSDADLGIVRGALTLSPRQATGRLHLPIDTFFRALAGDQRDRAIGVVLSGSGADGTEGLRAVKAMGGLTLAQSPESAQFCSMPQSALAAGVVDVQAPPEELARELLRLSRHPYVAATVAAGETGSSGPGEEKLLASILALVLQLAGVDFTGYKRTMVARRIEKRMALRRVGSLAEYAEALRHDPVEARSLAQEVLSHLSSFFRDSASFGALKQLVLLELLRQKDHGAPIRIWIPGCSTGEEAYGIAICLLEVLGDRAASFSIKIFGSDPSDEAIGAARTGLYSESALADVSADRLARFFDRAEGGYRVGQRVRDLCVFARHDVPRDPPFARLDLISCRDLLGSFDAELRRRTIPLLHTCLGTPGYLFLGQGESLSDFRDLFAPLDEEHHVFVKKGESRRTHPLAASRVVEAAAFRGARADRHLAAAREAQRQADHLLLARFSPPGVVVDERLEIVQFRGRTGAFLESPPGHPEANVLRMARAGLTAHLHEALELARAQSTTVLRENLEVETDIGPRLIDLEVVPLAGFSTAAERFFLILFHEAGPREASQVEPAPRASEHQRLRTGEASRLRAELLATKDYLQSLIGEHQGTADELAAANEELVASNEELQSANEELQSAQEELQSANEELGTVNDELRNRNADLDQIANDLVNVLDSVAIPVIIVDLDLRVRRFTPSVRDIANLIPEDVGRPIDDLTLKLKVVDVPERAREVIRELVPKEWEVERQDGRWLRMQIRPYRTSDNRLEGAVLSFVDVDVLKHALKDAEGARDYAKSIVETVTTALVVLDAQLRLVSANQAFYERFGLSRADVEGRDFFEIGPVMREDRSLRAALEEAASRSVRFSGLEVTAEVPRLGRKVLSLSGRPITWGGGSPMILLAIEDISDLRELESERTQLLASEKQARLDAERANRAKDLFLATLSHELRTPLSTMLLQSQLLKRMAVGDPRLERSSGAIERSARTQARLIDDLLDVSRIVSGKLLLDLGAVDLEEVVQGAVDEARAAAEAKSLRLEVVSDYDLPPVYGDAVRLQQVVSNLLTNAIKFTPHGGRVSVSLGLVGGKAHLAVADTGVGIRPEALPHLFSRFFQADSSVTRTHSGLGLGLAIVRHLVEVHGGEVRVESLGPGQGTTFHVTFPLGALSPPPALRTVARDIRGVRVLLVEDEDDVRQSFAAMLEQLGAEVRAAPSAAAGLAAVEEFRPQVILSDIAMAGEDGYSFIQKVRRLGPERGGQVPVAALTALASDEDRRRTREAGFQLHIAKPVDAAQLAAAVGALVEATPDGRALDSP